MNKIYLYAGYYELFITDKEMDAPYMYQGEFESVDEAFEFAWDNFDEPLIHYAFSICPEIFCDEETRIETIQGKKFVIM